MATLCCPHCGDPVRLPEQDLPLDTSVRCSWCQEIFTAEEISHALPPVLEIVSMGLSSDNLLETDLDFSTEPADELEESWDDVETIVDEPAEPDHEHLTVEELATGASDFSLEQGEINLDEGSDSDGADNLETNVQAGLAKLDELKPMKVKRFEQSTVRTSPTRRKKNSPIKGILATILGGLLSLPIAAGILSIAGRPLPIDLGFWPFNGNEAGQGVATRVPAATSREPLKRIGSSADKPPVGARLEMPEEIADKANTDATQEALSAISETSFDVAERPIPEPAEPSPGSSGIMEIPTPGGSEETAETTATDNKTIEEVEPGFALPAGVAQQPEAMAPSPAADTFEDNATESTIASEIIPPQDRATVFQPIEESLPSEVLERLEKSKAMLAKILNDPGKVDKKLGVKFYRGASVIAGQLKPEDIQQTEPLVELLEKIRGTKVEEYSRSASSLWIEAPDAKRKTPGVLVAGTASRDQLGQLIMPLKSGQLVELKTDSALEEGNFIGLGTIASEGDSRSIDLLITIPSQ